MARNRGIIGQGGGNPLAVSGGVDPVGLKNTSATAIDPATEGKQDDIITELQGIAASQLPDGHNVTIDNASIPVTDNGGSLTVDGAVSVTKSSQTAASPATVTIGTSSATLVSANGSRTGLIITNTHASNRLSLGFGATAVDGRGVVLWPRDSFVMDAFSFSTAQVNAIASAASTTVGVQEFS